MGIQNPNIFAGYFYWLPTFIRAYFTVLLVTLSTWCIANNRPIATLLISIGISIAWVGNVSAVANGKWQIKIAYTVGALLGTATTLKITGMI